MLLPGYRRRLRTAGGGVPDKPDRAADYSIERGTGRKLTNEEAVRILEMCEEQGLVHVAENKQGVGHVICNCWQ